MSSTERGIERVRHGPHFRVAEVVSAEHLTPRMRRVVFQSPDLADFRSAAYDDHIRLFFPPPGSREIARPSRGPNRLVFPPGTARPEARDYTPRAFDPAQNRLTVDFVLHGEGPGSSFAARARPGDVIGIAGPQNSLIVRGSYGWYLLIGDETALPAIGRRIEELGAGVRVVAFIEIANAAERQTFATAAKTEIVWVERDRAKSNPAAGLLDAVRAATLPKGTGFSFVAAENSAARTIRRHLVEERRFDPDTVKAYRFWQRGEADLGQSG
jgi:NADPH-dependent ferric siderophore reductase